ERGSRGTALVLRHYLDRCHQGAGIVPDPDYSIAASIYVITRRQVDQAMQAQLRAAGCPAAGAKRHAQGESAHRVQSPAERFVMAGDGMHEEPKDVDGFTD